MPQRITIHGTGRLDEVAEAVLDALNERRIVLFRGEMGAGKTTLVRAIAARLGASDTVTSPTFALVNPYQTSEGPVYHFDFYRINRIEEAFDLGYDEYFYSGNLCLVEWPERIESLLPADAMTVRIEVDGPEDRTFVIDESPDR